MNIDDIKKKIKVPDKPVNTIFEMQRELMEKYDLIERANGFEVSTLPYSLDDKFVQARLKDIFWRVTEELAEAIDVIPTLSQLNRWKELWDTEADIRHYFEEIADALHFLVEASIISGLHTVIGVEKLLDILPNKNPDLEIKSIMSNIIFAMGIAANTLKNKPWKQTHVPTDVQKFRNKLIVVWIAFTVLWQKLNCSIEDVYILYVKKHDVNVWRQDTNY